jgi:hypothetical protein
MRLFPIVRTRPTAGFSPEVWYATYRQTSVFRGKVRIGSFSY